MRGKLWLEGWHGRTGQAVEVVGETPKRYRIRAIEKDTRLAGPRRQLDVGETALVPKHAVTIEAEVDNLRLCAMCGRPIRYSRIGESIAGEPRFGWCDSYGPDGHAPIDCPSDGYHVPRLDAE